MPQQYFTVSNETMNCISSVTRFKGSLPHSDLKRGPREMVRTTPVKRLLLVSRSWASVFGATVTLPG